MSEEGFEEWDADFLDQLIQVEELALSSTQHLPPPPQPPPPPPPLLLQHIGPSHDNTDISYSPPRELSQRTIDYSNKKPFTQSSNGIATSAAPRLRRSGNANEVEIDRLKRELGHVSKQLTHLIGQLHERTMERTVYNLDAVSTSKSVGIQTDKAGDSTHLTINSSQSTHCDLSNKLLAIWGSPTGQRSGRNLVSKLFVACATDFHVIFGCLNMNLSSKITLGSLEDDSSSDVALQEKFQSSQSFEAAKVSHLYTVLTMISNGMVQLESLLEALLDLCNLENVVIVYRSLRILRVVLNDLLSLEKKSERRDNVTVEGLGPRSNVVDFNGSDSAKTGGMFCVRSDKTSCSGHSRCGMRIFDSDIPCKNGCCNDGTAILSSCVDWVSLFELMHQISMRNTEEHVRYEAVSIMNVVFMKSNAYLEREKFGQTLVLESVSQLLRKEAGLRVQKQAVHLLYLLLNCPKLLVIFCSGCKEGGSAVAGNEDAKNSSAFRGFSIILEGLADCLAGCGNGAQDLKLRRNAIIVLAFLASSGNSGFEILLSHKLSRRSNFLVLILQALVSEMDIEATESTEPAEIFKERTLLIREALIFLNRVVSNPVYSSTVLRVLTNSRDVTSLTVKIANRLSQKGQRHWQSDSMTRQMRECEIVDLARVFKKRVFTFLGDNIS
ncbi:hypothetical protein L1049_022603 [Liquidambar formosana]|uniref:Uncharacterized protein n=1 Tax=Liquidambar formosana TaxID=63359 RepID=A0AAP0RD79_LIQFO